MRKKYKKIMDKYKKKIEQICPQSVAGVAGCNDQQFIIQTNIKNGQIYGIK